MSTIFDQILAGTIPCNKVFENEHVVSFHDISPQAPVHVLIIPKTKLVNLCDITQDTIAAMGHFLEGVSLVAKHLHLEEGGYRVVINNGKDAMQTVDYLHAHILAGRTLNWPPG